MKKIVYEITSLGLLVGIAFLLPHLVRAQVPPASTSLYCLANPGKCAPDTSGTTNKVNKAGGGRIFIDTDTWLGKGSVVEGPQVHIGSNTLIVTGGTAGVPSGNGSIGISTYTLPTTGKINWNAVQQTLIEEVQRVYSTRYNLNTTEGPCVPDPDDLYTAPSDEQVIHDLWLDGRHTLISGSKLPTPVQLDSIVWVDNRDPNYLNKIQGSNPFRPGGGTKFSKICKIILEDATIHVPPRGATFVDIYNMNDFASAAIGSINSAKLEGGMIEFRGKIKVDPPTASFGYVTMRNPQIDDTSGKEKHQSGQVIITGNAQLNNIALFTNGTITIEPNSSYYVDNHQYVRLVGKDMSFPIAPPDNSHGDTFFENSAVLESNPPPLFANLALPSGKDSP